MKLASFLVEGQPAWGVVTDAGLVDGRTLLCGRFGSLRELLAADALAALRAALPQARATLPRSAVRWRAPIPEPGKIFCVGLNYRAHVEEVGRPLPAEPSIFVRLSDTLIADGEPIERPRVSHQLDYEGELAVVIGRGGRHIAASDALGHVAGYSLFNDVSVRDWQKHSVSAGKNFAASAPFGPWIVTADEIPDPGALTLRTRVNGLEVQHASVATMRYPIPALIAYLSTIIALAPGDLIATGTPAGVGSRRSPPLWLRDGDRVEIEVERIGVLGNPVRDEAGA